MKTTVSCKITFSPQDQCWYVEAPGFYNGILTDGDTLDHAKEMACEAVSGIIAVNLKHNVPFSIPAPIEGDGIYDIEIEPSLAFALWLRNARIARDMTLQDAAEKMGVKYQVYQKLENPRTANPTLKTMKKLEQVFGEELVSV
jgi:antitoxin HicB